MIDILSDLAIIRLEQRVLKLEQTIENNQEMKVMTDQSKLNRIPAAIQIHDNVNAELVKSVLALEERLQPVLSAGKPASNEPAGPPVQNTIACKIDASASVVTAIVSKLADIYSRLEV